MAQPGVAIRGQRSLLRQIREALLEIANQEPDVALSNRSALEGAMLLARLFGDVAGFRSATTHLLTGLLADPSNGTPAKRQVSVR